MIYICIVPGCLSVMGHSFTITTDTDVLIWHNESQFSFPHTDSNTSSEKISMFSKKIYNVDCNKLYLLLFFLQLLSIFLKIYIK